jgi:hypothetical protein
MLSKDYRNISGRGFTKNKINRYEKRIKENSLFHQIIRITLLLIRTFKENTKN